MLLSQSWKMKTLHFMMTQVTATTSHRVRGTLNSRAFALTPFGKWGNLFQVICSFAFSGVEEEESLSSEEDVPFRDDLNDQSYDPKAERCASVSDVIKNSQHFFV